MRAWQTRSPLAFRWPSEKFSLLLFLSITCFCAGASPSRKHQDQNGAWQTRSSPRAWWHAWTSWIRLRLPLRSGASARVDPIGILRTTALPIIAQSFVPVLFRKAEAQRILCNEMTQACYDFETFSTCGPKRKPVSQQPSKLYAIFCSHSLQKSLGPRNSSLPL